MANKEYPYIRFKVLRAKNLKYLFEQFDDEARPFEMVAHPPIGKTGTRPVTIKASSYEDATYFSGILKKLSYESLDRLTYGADKVKP